MPWNGIRSGLASLPHQKGLIHTVSVPEWLAPDRARGRVGRGVCPPPGPLLLPLSAPPPAPRRSTCHPVAGEMVSLVLSLVLSLTLSPAPHPPRPSYAQVPNEYSPYAPCTVD